MRVALVTKVWRRPRMASLWMAYHSALSWGEDSHPILVAAVSPEDPDLPEVSVPEGVALVEAPNGGGTPEALAARGNAAVQEARRQGAEVIINLGSDDFVSAGYVRRVVQAIEAGHEYVIPSEVFVYDVPTRRAVRVFNQYGLGAGRAFAASLVDRLEGALWDASTGLRPDRALDHRLRGVPPFLMPERSGVVLATTGSGTFWTFEMAARGRWREPVHPARVLRHLPRLAAGFDRLREVDHA